MRYTVRRIGPWSAAKVGALVGIIHGLAFGIALASLSAALGPALAYLGEMMIQPTWPVVLLAGAMGGSAGAVMFAVGALIYNVMSWLGASFVVELRPEDAGTAPLGSKAAQTPSPRGELLGSPTFTRPILGSA